MIKEEATERLKAILAEAIADEDAVCYVTSDDADALEMAIKALEQTSALDKIRDEIAEYGSIWVEYYIPGHTDHDIETIVGNVLKQAKKRVLAVIDKYRGRK